MGEITHGESLSACSSSKLNHNAHCNKMARAVALSWKSLILAGFYTLTVANPSDGNGYDCRVCRVDMGGFSECWNQSLSHFTKTAEKGLNDIASALIHLSRWKKEQNSAENFEETVLDQTLMEYESLSDDEKGILSAEDFKHIFSVIFNRTRDLEDDYKDAIYLPSLSCPVPCDYADRMYVALFFVLMVAFFLVVIAFLVYLFLIHRKTDKDGQVRTVRGNSCLDNCSGLL